VGVVGDVKHRGLEAASNPEAYLSYLQTHFVDQARRMTLVLRGEGSAMAVAAAMRQAVSGVDPEQPIGPVRLMDDLIAESVAPRRLNLWLLGSFALLALVLTGEGLYGVMSYLVAQRAREIGVRVALGARPAHVVALIVRQMGGMALLGTALGILLALGLSGLLESLVFGIKPTEPTVYAATSAILLVVALGAVLLPVRRALRVDPATALRQEA
jgi:predicted lysophospholipase L1 biosynthesis ABC-type transport system permease subunit